ncbi:hypothetical protein B7H23_00840 [Notoacmeibacter marinus]|uniref:Lectin-like protein BA14k n=1 Tax=Notoacmeibacter marinus TaxID=1876515 RepID=A0A231V039_9HYPH|nr:hypothetical protein B7H23_00840 [Notoacmeibacter marinus]
MKKMMTIAAIAAAIGFTGVGPAQAAPLSIPAAPQTTSTNTPQNVDFRVRGGIYFYNGHRGSRRWHRGWREYRGWYFPPRAFYRGGYYRTAPRYYYPDRPRRYYKPRYRYSDGFSRAHYRWCHNRYRSYRSYDNTFQPYHGPRRQCYSPYD